MFINLIGQNRHIVFSTGNFPWLYNCEIMINKILHLDILLIMHWLVQLFFAHSCFSFFYFNDYNWMLKWILTIKQSPVGASSVTYYRSLLLPAPQWLGVVYPMSLRGNGLARSNLLSEMEGSEGGVGVGRRERRVFRWLFITIPFSLLLSLSSLLYHGDQLENQSVNYF